MCCGRDRDRGRSVSRFAGRGWNIEYKGYLIDERFGKLVDVGLDDARVLERVPAEAEEEDVVDELRGRGRERSAISGSVGAMAIARGANTILTKRTGPRMKTSRPRRKISRIMR